MDITWNWIVVGENKKGDIWLIGPFTTKDGAEYWISQKFKTDNVSYRIEHIEPPY